MSGHYTMEELEMYCNKDLPLLKRIMCKQHLKHCTECSDLVKEIEKDKEFADEIHSAIKELEKFSK